MKRRTFVTGATAGIMAAPVIHKSTHAAPSNTVVMGVVGCGGWGSSLLRRFLEQPGVQVKTICDVDRSKFARVAGIVQEARGAAPQMEQDFRRMLEDPDIDAVQIVTGHNWHALAAIWACQAGKDVYVEKPVGLTLFEGRQVAEAARKYKRVVQVGTQTHSAPYYLDALQYARSGKLGDIHLMRSQIIEESSPEEMPKPGPPEPVPEGLDWDMWCGPAPLVPYHPGRWFWRKWDLNAGGFSDHYSHQVDLMKPLIAEPFPKTVYCTGGVHHFTDGREHPDTQLIVIEYDRMNVLIQGVHWTPAFDKAHLNLVEADGYPHWLTSSHINILGTKGAMFLARAGAGWQVFNEPQKIVTGGHGKDGMVPHIQNFLDCIKTRNKPNADADHSHQAMAMIHLANAAIRLGGRKLEFDPVAQTVKNDPEANKLLKRTGRAPWIIPEEV